MVKIVIGCDNTAFLLKQVIMSHLQKLGYEFEDMGTYTEKETTNYPLIAERVSRAILDDGYDRGILLCGTGIGMCIAANKVPGIYAALCHDCFSAERARKSNNAQVITMGARVIGPELAKTKLYFYNMTIYQQYVD